MKYELLDRNPFVAVDTVRVPKPELVIWEPAEIRRFLKVTAASKFHTLFYLTISTGLRISEVRGDLDGHLLHVKRQISGYSAKAPKFIPSKPAVVYEPYPSHLTC